MKKITSTVLALAMLSSVGFSAAACGPTVVEDVDTSKTQLYIGSVLGGTGYEWLDNAAERFEKKYANASFEDNKTGVQIIIDHSKKYSGWSLTTVVPGNINELFFASGVPYFEMAGTSLMDISDLVTEWKHEDDGKTIYSKMDTVDQEALKVNGKYYAIPYVTTFTGASYDAGVFQKRNLYFSAWLDTADTVYPGTNAFVRSNADKKSCGPDGVFGNYDDGLPSTLDEMYKLVDKMLKESITPFVFTGASTHYTNMLFMGLFTNLLGAKGMQASFTFDSQGEEIDVVTGFNGDTPVIEKMAITKENANKVRSSQAYYEAAKFCQKIFSDSKYYYKDGASTTFSHLDAHEKFLKSGLDGNEYIGCIIEGDYWYNEASMDGIVDDLKDTYPTTYQQKDVRFMPFPRQLKGTVTPGEGKAPVVVDTAGYYAFMNANTPANHVEVAKKFLSFVYTDAELKQATIDSRGVTRAVKYDTSAAQNLSPYAQSVFTIRAAAEENNSYIRAFSGDEIFKRNQLKLMYSTCTHYLNSQKDKNSPLYTDIYSAFKAGASLKDYFLGLGISDTDWATKYNIHS